MNKYKVYGLKFQKSYSGGDAIKYNAVVTAKDTIDAIIKFIKIFGNYESFKQFTIIPIK